MPRMGRVIPWIHASLALLAVAAILGPAAPAVAQGVGT